MRDLLDGLREVAGFVHSSRWRPALASVRSSTMAGESGIFDVVQQLLRSPGLDEEELMRNAGHVLTGPRGRKIVFLEDGFKGTREDAAGITSTSTGNVYISGDIKGDPKELHGTVRHELFHSVLTPRSQVLNFAHRAVLTKSPTYVYLHEAAAEVYGSRSLRQGMKFPFKYGYVRPSWIATEIGVLGFGGYVAVGAVQDETG